MVHSQIDPHLVLDCCWCLFINQVDALLLDMSQSLCFVRLFDRDRAEQDIFFTMSAFVWFRTCDEVRA